MDASQLALRVHAAALRLGLTVEAADELTEAVQPDLDQVVAERDGLLAERARYVGVEPAIAAELKRGWLAAHEVCDAAERQALQWEQPLPVPEWVGAVRTALDGPGGGMRVRWVEGCEAGANSAVPEVLGGGTHWEG
ncbi:hypothetical protein [Kitasatospora sp. NPDC047058]|uniref:hypothetical protein n=1 Tax=Kitasatospora sp. NPDC047058 TaxID=3155620 RepID=UPI0033FB3114